MQANHPLVSVVVSCYNHKEFIEECILSVVNQTYQNIELLVFDDGSTDGSGKVIGKLADDYHFAFRQQENIGLPATLNSAFGYCVGDYIAILGSDDVFLPEKIEKQIAFMEGRKDIAVCGANILCVDDNNQVLEKQKTKPYREVEFNSLFSNTKLAPAASSAMIRSTVFQDVGGFNPNIPLEDLYLWLKITFNGYKIAVLEDTLVHYREHETNSHKNYKLMTESMIEIFQEYTHHRDYLPAINKILIRMFLKTSKLDKPYAFGLLKKIHPKFYNLKVLRGIFHMSKPRLGARKI